MFSSATTHLTIYILYLRKYRIIPVASFDRNCCAAAFSVICGDGYASVDHV